MAQTQRTHTTEFDTSRTQHKLHPNKTHENAWFLAVLTILKTQRLQAEKQFLLERQDWENLSNYISAPIIFFLPYS